MIELASLLGGVSALLLLIAIAAWLKMGRTPLLRRLDGRAELDSAQGQAAAQLLVAALGLSAAAALLAVIGWIAG